MTPAVEQEIDPFKSAGKGSFKVGGHRGGGRPVGLLLPKQTAEEHFLAGAVALNQMPDELQRVAGDEQDQRHQPLLKGQQDRRGQEACGNPQHVQVEIRRVAMSLPPIGDPLGEGVAHGLVRLADSLAATDTKIIEKENDFANCVANLSGPVTE